MPISQPVYLESTVWYQMANYASSGLKSRVEQLFERIEHEDYAIYISNVVLEELAFNTSKYRSRVEDLIRKYQPAVVMQPRESDIVVEAYLENAFVGREAEAVVVDAYHAAVAVTAGITYMASCNHRNLLNVRILEQLNAVNLLAGLNRRISIYPPFMFLDLEEYDGETGGIHPKIWGLKTTFGRKLLERLSDGDAERRKEQRDGFTRRAVNKLGLKVIDVS